MFQSQSSSLARQSFLRSLSTTQYKVNLPFTPNLGRFPAFKPINNQAGKPDLTKHKKKNWTAAEQAQAIKDNSIFTWGASEPARELAIPVSRASGVYLYGLDGKQYFDLSSQAMCANLGHSVPDIIKQAVQDQMSDVCYVYGDLYTTEIRARLSALLAELFPGDLNSFLFASGGSEANEAAIRMARKFTGRHKIMSRYRSYHGGTTNALAMTGDSRRWPVDSSVTGFIKIMDPYPFHFKWDEKDEMVGIQRCLDALHDQILFEGPNTIAAIVLESITGTNGWLVPPALFMQGVRSLCDQYGIILICDEVMTGFGRTGKMFGFEHFEGVLPDIVTFAKGVTSSFIPLSGLAARDHIFEFFKKNPVGYGSTYSFHPVACAAGYATVQYILENDIVGHVKKMELVMKDELNKLVNKHPCVKQARVAGMAGGVDLQDKDGNFLLNMHEVSDGVTLLKKRFKEEGIWTVVRGHFIHCVPPLVSTEAEIRDAFQRLDRCLDSLDDWILKKH